LQQAPAYQTSVKSNSIAEELGLDFNHEVFVVGNYLKGEILDNLDSMPTCLADPTAYCVRNLAILLAMQIN
jgi:hypothetical protein